MLLTKPVFGRLVLALLYLAAGLATPVVPARSYRKVFSDDFNTIDLSRGGLAEHTWCEGVWFHHQHAPLGNISVANSVLSLDWRENQTSPDTSISSFCPGRRSLGVSTHAWRYGYFEARMKWDVVPGAWPAFWLIPVEGAQGLVPAAGSKETGEIDIFEGQGDHPHTFYGTVHDWVGLLRISANEDNHFALLDNVKLSEFHVYGVLWTPGKVSWYFDGRRLHTEKTPAVLDREHCFLVLGMQEGVNWKVGDRSGVAQAKMSLQVDWVHVWQK